MKVIWLAAMGSIVLFWAYMNSRLLSRILEYRGLDEYRRGAIDFLGDRVRRERQMGIYRKGGKIGFTRFAMERTFENEEMGFLVESTTRIDIDVLGQGGTLDLSGEASLDSKMVPRKLSARIGIGGLTFRLEGRREGDRLLLAVKDREGRTVFQHLLPLEELLLGDGLAPALPVAGLKPGETYRVPVFDPIFRESALAETTVLEKAVRRPDGISVDCLLLETRFRGMAFRSYVTSDGEILVQELPPPLDVILRREAVSLKGIPK